MRRSPLWIVPWTRADRAAGPASGSTPTTRPACASTNQVPRRHVGPHMAQLLLPAPCTSLTSWNTCSKAERSAIASRISITLDPVGAEVRHPAIGLVSPALRESPHPPADRWPGTSCTSYHCGRTRRTCRSASRATGRLAWPGRSATRRTSADDRDGDSRLGSSARSPARHPCAAD